MSDLISREAVIAALTDTLQYEGMVMDELISVVANITAADVVEVVRCKDCKHRHIENMVWTCPFGLPGGENFFCGYGAEPYKGEQE